MDRFWGNQTEKEKIKSKKYATSSNKVEPPNPAYEEQPFREAEEGVWDFSRASANPESPASFKYSRRPEPIESYRVVGQSVPASRRVPVPATPKVRTPAPASHREEIVSRSNRANASVKMVAGDSGPAPWDEWGEVNYLKLPIMGEVAAGRYDVTVAYHEPGAGADADFVFINPQEIKVNRGTFALRVRGQSMVDNEIDHGDVIIVQAQDWADDGDFVIACLADSTDPNGFVTLKRFYRHKHADRVVLQPANQSLSPIHIFPRKGNPKREDLDGVKIQGRVTAVIKAGGL